MKKFVEISFIMVLVSISGCYTIDPSINENHRKIAMQEYYGVRNRIFQETKEKD